VCSRACIVGNQFNNLLMAGAAEALLTVIIPCLTLSFIMQNSRRSHDIEILETPYATVSSGGHWFHATRETVKEYVPELMKTYSFEELVSRAVNWIDSADSLAMLLYFSLIPFVNVWISALIVLVFHYFWYHQKSAFGNYFIDYFINSKKRLPS